MLAVYQAIEASVYDKICVTSDGTGEVAVIGFRSKGSRSPGDSHSHCGTPPQSPSPYPGTFSDRADETASYGS